MLWAGRDQSGGCHLVGYDDSIVPLSPIPLLLLAHSPQIMLFSQWQVMQQTLTPASGSVFFESLLTCLHLQEFVSGGFVQNYGWLTLVCGVLDAKQE